MEETFESSQQSKGIKMLIDKGSELAGSISGAMIGSIFLDAIGIVAGATYGLIVTESLKKVGAELSNRLLGDRQKVRVGAAFIYAIDKIDQKLISGEQIREDIFLESSSISRPTAEEILEGAMLLAQNEYEERKVKHYGFLVANMYFDQSIDRGFANYLLRTAEKLSYRQLCLVELFNDSRRFELYKQYVPEVEGPFEYIFRSINNIDPKLYPLFSGVTLKTLRADLDSEIRDLDQQGLIKKPKMSEQYDKVVLTELGGKLRNLMELNTIDFHDIENNANFLRYIDIPPTNSKII